MLLRLIVKISGPDAKGKSVDSSSFPSTPSKKYGIRLDDAVYDTRKLSRISDVS